MQITVEYRGQDHEVFMPDELYNYLKTDEEQLNKYLLDTLQNKMNKKTNTSELQKTQTGQTYLQQLFYGETSGCEDEHDEHTAANDITNNNGAVAVAVLEPDKFTTVMNGDVTLSSSNTDRWPKNHVLVLIDAFEINKHMFSSTTIRKEKVWQVISKHLKNTGINKTAIQCDNKWKNLRKLYLKKQRNKKATCSGQSAFHFEFEEEFDKIYKDEPSISPVALAGNLIVEENVAIFDNDSTEDMPKAKKRKTDSINGMHLFIEKKEENRQKRHIEMMELQNKSLQLQQDAVEAYKNTMDQFLTIYKNNSTK